MTISHSEEEAEEEVCENVPESPTHKLAYFFWHDISGNEGSYDDAFLDVNFVRRICSNAKRVLKQGADLETVSAGVALVQVNRGSGGMSYYQAAEAEVKKRDAQPPIWDYIAYEEWRIRRDRKLSRTTEDNNI